MCCPAVKLEESDEVNGVLFLLNTVGGDVEAGLAIAELIARHDKAYGLHRPGRKPFHRRAFGSGCPTELCRPQRRHDHPPGPHERHGHRRPRPTTTSSGFKIGSWPSSPATAR
ncbi:hypothetical protein [Oscillibacter sp.]|uniref:hypothetical protein n=1 Tax=Oscillibacter sp. TaxID=1945593 RepID=UPI00338D73F8